MDGNLVRGQRSKGQRVEDAISWAKEILNRYAPNYELEEAW